MILRDHCRAVRDQVSSLGAAAQMIGNGGIDDAAAGRVYGPRSDPAPAVRHCLATMVTTVAAGATVQLGLADWGWSAGATNKLPEPGLATAIIMIAMSTLMVQGFPEELVFRGYMFRNLGETLSLWATVTTSSLIFGSMHVFSNGGATTLGERVLYTVAMTGFGLMLAACRTVSGTLWLGIGSMADSTRSTASSSRSTTTPSFRRG